ncbi:MAG: MobA/MobL family protein [Steroidobacteraceae bacterium]
MASYHAHVRPGPKGAGAEHAQYIERGGRFSVERYGEIGESERGNLPAWAGGSAARFFAVADERERANGNAYREFELALPVELTEEQRGQLVRAFVAEQLGERHAYAWAIHEPAGHNPHVHIMFSERIRDGIERGPEQYFKRANTQHPELGGHAKSDWFTGKGGPKAVEALRVRWEQVQNLALERAGIEVRVDHRSLEAQGIEREAGQHRGPVVSALHARGQEAEVSVRREAERTMQHEAALRAAPKHQEIVAELREVTREEVAGQRSAARERRELLPETDGTLRRDLEHQVESDRREQIARVEAQVERRIERRMGLTGGWGERLLEQARALRDRVLELGGRVREWVQGLWQRREQGLERGPVLESTGQADGQAVRERPTIDLAAVKAQGRAASERWREALHERQAQAKQRELEQRSRERVVQSFQELALSRGGRRRGYGDRSDEWRATPAALREQIDRYNSLPQNARQAALERLVQEPAQVRTLERWLEERRQRVRELDRGLER